MVAYGEKVEEILCVFPRSIIEGQGDDPIRVACVQALAVGNIPNFWTSNVFGIGPLGTNISVAGWSVV